MKRKLEQFESSADEVPFNQQRISVSLCDGNLWETFHIHTSEMVITSAGRCVFPNFKVNVTGLEPYGAYNVGIEFIPSSNIRWKYLNEGKKWTQAGNVISLDSLKPSSTFIHPDGLKTGSYWMSHEISFAEVKLSNKIHPPIPESRHIITLKSFQKYLIRFSIFKSSVGSVSRSLVGSWQFPETEFVAVTSYQNEKIKDLKKASNPFARAFRISEDDVIPSLDYKFTPEKIINPSKYSLPPSVDAAGYSGILDTSSNDESARQFLMCMTKSASPHFQPGQFLKVESDSSFNREYADSSMYQYFEQPKRAQQSMQNFSTKDSKNDSLATFLHANVDSSNLPRNLPLLEPTSLLDYSLGGDHDKIEITLLDKNLWQKFKRLTTEMIITNKGRCLFPFLKLEVTGLNPCLVYSIAVEFLALNNIRWKYYRNEWIRSGDICKPAPSNIYYHSSSPEMGSFWEKETLQFTKIKLANKETSGANIILNSFQRYYVCAHVLLVDEFNKKPTIVRSRKFPETEFIAVTCYQNPAVKKLKKALNPFAKNMGEDQTTDAGDDSDPNDGGHENFSPSQDPLKFLLNSPLSSSLSEKKPLPLHLMLQGDHGLDMINECYHPLLGVSGNASDDVLFDNSALDGEQLPSDCMYELPQMPPAVDSSYGVDPKVWATNPFLSGNLDTAAILSLFE